MPRSAAIRGGFAALFSVYLRIASMTTVKLGSQRSNLASHRSQHRLGPA